MEKEFQVLIKKIIKETKEYEKSLTPTYKKNSGSYYTDYSLAKYMIEELFQTFKKSYDLTTKKILEPCVGTGIFIFAFLEQLLEKNYSKESMIMIIQNIYISDSNIEAIAIYKENLIIFCQKILNYHLDSNYFSTHILDYLIYDLTNPTSKYVSLSSYLNFKFDIIIANPPYKNLKLTKQENQLPSSSIYKNYFDSISKEIKTTLKLSTSGVINIYKLFVEEILCNYSTSNAFIVLLVPNTILTDKSCLNLRKYILNHHKIISITNFDENNPYLKARQALCTFLIQKNEPTTNIKIKINSNTSPYTIPIHTIQKNQSNLSIFLISKLEYQILDKLAKFPKIKDLDFIHNLRGELDLSFHKDFFQDSITELPLIRGKLISEYNLLPSEKIEYVIPKFLNLTHKIKYIQQPRIACQQVSNLTKEKRIQFSFIPSNYVLANSCNFISVSPNIFHIDLYYLLGLLNSELINWYFKLFNSNNHISNYEINEFPIPTQGKEIKEISTCVQNYLQTNDQIFLQKINHLVNILYGITDNFLL